MRVTVIGAGHVELVTAVCLARIGHEMVADDDDRSKLELLRRGKAWFYEPQLQELMTEALAAGRLRFTSDKAQAVRHGEVIFICVGTPSRNDGSPNLRHVESVAERFFGMRLRTGRCPCGSAGAGATTAGCSAAFSGSFFFAIDSGWPTLQLSR